MPRLYARLQGFKLEQGKFTKALDTACQRLVREAAREGLRALVLRVPVWSGMALGSIKHARGPGGSLSSFLRVSIPINPVETKRRKHERSQPGTFNFTTSNHVYRFRVRSDVFHYILHEFNPRPSYIHQQIKAPWKSFSAMQNAFVGHIRRNAHRLPKVKEFIIRTPPISA
jgi:hypothetical protein